MRSQFIRRAIKPLKPVLSRTIWPERSVRTVLWGPCRGLRYRIFPDMGLSPLYGGWEPEAQALMVKNIRNNSVVYDVGANYGIHTLLMARLAASGFVYAFEPVPTILAALQENISLNSFQNVECVPLAVADVKGEACFTKGSHVGAGSLALPSRVPDDQIQVSTITLDQFVFELKNRPPNFIKMDIEGAEGNALRGASRVLEEFRPVLLIDLHTPEQDIDVGRTLLRYGYSAFHTDNMVQVEDLSKGWPNSDGLWGEIVAYPQ